MAEVPHRTIRSIALEKGTKPDQMTDFDREFNPANGTPRRMGVKDAAPMDDAAGASDLAREPTPFVLTGG